MKARACLNCGGPFYTYASRTRFCSRACVGAYRSNNPAAVLARVRLDDPDACWPWFGHTDRAGYGRITIAGATYRTHRIAWEVANGRSAGDLSVLHSCDNPPCCNPAHLRLGTARENTHDCVERGRRASFRGVRNSQAKLTDQAVVEIRRRVAAGELHRDVATDFGISRQVVGRVVNCVLWAHVDDGAFA